MSSKKLPIVFSLTLAVLPVCAQVSGEPVAAQRSVVFLDQSARIHGPILDRVKNTDGSVTSTNWGGYAVTGADNSFTYAAGSWVIPAVTCESRQSSYAAFWVGIDGYSSSTVEQTGTVSDCDRGKPVYSAWYEFYPAVSVTINTIKVTPGDVMSAWVSYANSEFTTWIEDVTTGVTFSISSAVSGAERSSAEWIVEAHNPLADFGTSLFGVDYTGVASTNCATEGGSCMPISSYSTWEAITIESKRKIEAVPSALSSDGTSFSVSYQ